MIIKEKILYKKILQKLEMFKKSSAKMEKEQAK